MNKLCMGVPLNKKEILNATKTFYGKPKLFYHDGGIIDITQNIRDDYYDVTVQITTFEGAHNPPYGFDTITLRIQSFEVINYEHKDVSNIGKIPLNTLKTSTYLTTQHLINGESNFGLEVLIFPSPFLIYQSGTQLLFHLEKLQSLFPLYTPSSFPLVLRINSYRKAGPDPQCANALVRWGSGP